MQIISTTDSSIYYMLIEWDDDNDNDNDNDNDRDAKNANGAAMN